MLIHQENAGSIHEDKKLRSTLNHWLYLLPNLAWDFGKRIKKDNVVKV